MINDICLMKTCLGFPLPQELYNGTTKKMKAFFMVEGWK